MRIKAVASARAPALQTWVADAFVLECFRLAGALDRVGAGHVGAARMACSRACVIQSGRERQHSKLGWRVPLFWSASGLAELWIASEREHVGASGRACSRACVIQSGRERQHSKLGWRGGCVLECFRLGGALDYVGAGTRRSGWESVFPSMRHPKRARARERQHSKLGWRVPLFWSASGLPELWITSEREHVGAAGRACSRACVIQSGRERASASTQTWVAGAFVLECFRLAGALDYVGAGTRGSGWESVFPSVRHPKRSRAPALQTWVTRRLCFGVLPA